MNSMWGSVQTLRGCPKHCSFCSVWRTDGQQPRQRIADAVVREVVELRRRGFRFILLSDDNFYPVTKDDLTLAERQGNLARLESLKEIRAERFELMTKLAALPDDLVFYTQITMEAAEDPEFLQAMRQILVERARARGAQKRWGALNRVSITDSLQLAADPEVMLPSLDEALDKLEAIDPEQARIVELRYFAGMSVEEAADAMAMSPATLKRRWSLARAWLFRELSA